MTMDQERAGNRGRTFKEMIIDGVSGLEPGRQLVLFEPKGLKTRFAQTRTPSGFQLEFIGSDGNKTTFDYISPVPFEKAYFSDPEYDDRALFVVPREGLFQYVEFNPQTGEEMPESSWSIIL